jgi:FMN phosphatase YigB (HAD superfamily)
MFRELARLYGVTLSASTHVGDSEKDRDAAMAAGVGTFVWARDFFGWDTAPGRS